MVRYMVTVKNSEFLWYSGKILTTTTAKPQNWQCKIIKNKNCHYHIYTLAEMHLLAVTVGQSAGCYGATIIATSGT